MNATELLERGGASSGVFRCSKCKRVWTDSHCAERCCLCSFCNEPTNENPGSAYYFTHRVCREKQDAGSLAKRIDKAVKLETWDGWVCNEGAGGGPNDGYASSMEELIEHLEEKIADGDLDHEDWPQWVFVCESKNLPEVDIHNILDVIGDEMFEDWDEHLVGVEKLEAALKEFNTANKGLMSYIIDYKRVVRVPPAEKRCQTCGKVGDDVADRTDNGLACGRHCKGCFDTMVSEARSRSW